MRGWRSSLFPPSLVCRRWLCQHLSLPPQAAARLAGVLASGRGDRAAPFLSGGRPFGRGRIHAISAGMARKWESKLALVLVPQRRFAHSPHLSGMVERFPPPATFLPSLCRPSSPGVTGDFLP